MNVRSVLFQIGVCISWFVYFLVCEHIWDELEHDVTDALVRPRHLERLNLEERRKLKQQIKALE